MPGKDPVNDQLPTSDGGYQPYLAAGKLRGKKALITGGDSGIGRAVAILYAMEGAESTIVHLPEEEKDAQETVRLVQEKGGKLHCIAADLRSHQACKNVVEKALELMGNINILVLNHGYQMMIEKIDDLTEDQWINTFATNIHPFFFLAKYTLPHMSRGDTIITCASINHYIGRPDLLDYTSTKGAIVAFTRALSNQQLDRGIRVNTVCPGPSMFYPFFQPD
jgi:NAD(P)-dependent dehydrogenase (short-subunit alcohol dehydrogenase family)